MGLHVDLVDRRGDEQLQGVPHGTVLARQREHRAIVACVARPIEQVDAGDGLDGRGHPVDDVDSSTFGDVRDGLDQHSEMLARATAARGSAPRGPSWRSLPELEVRGPIGAVVKAWR